MGATLIPGRLNEIGSRRQAGSWEAASRPVMQYELFGFLKGSRQAMVYAAPLRWRIRTTNWPWITKATTFLQLGIFCG
jgi:hypothetical protein